MKQKTKKDENRKKWGRLGIMFVVCFTLGVAIGVGGVLWQEFGFSVISMDNMGHLLLGLFVVILGIQLVLSLMCAYYRGTIKKDGYRNEEHCAYEKVEDNMGMCNGIGSSLTVFSIPLIGAVVYTGASMELLLWTVGIMILGMGVNTYNELALLKVIGKVDPTKNVDWSRKKFHENYYDSLDECEKEEMGRVGSRLITSMHGIFSAVFISCILLSNFFEFSGFEFVIVGLIWFIFTVFLVASEKKFKKAAKEMSKKGNYKTI